MHQSPEEYVDDANLKPVLTPVQLLQFKQRVIFYANCTWLKVFISLFYIHHNSLLFSLNHVHLKKRLQIGKLK